MRRPYGFLERFDPNFTPNTTDMDGRRYTYRAQPGIGHWNCAQLANALIAAGLVPLVSSSRSWGYFCSICCAWVVFLPQQSLQCLGSLPAAAWAWTAKQDMTRVGRGFTR